jgi:hypothetical protein
LRVSVESGRVQAPAVRGACAIMEALYPRMAATRGLYGHKLKHTNLILGLFAEPRLTIGGGTNSPPSTAAAAAAAVITLPRFLQGMSKLGLPLTAAQAADLASDPALAGSGSAELWPDGTARGVDHGGGGGGSSAGVTGGTIKFRVFASRLHAGYRQWIQAEANSGGGGGGGGGLGQKSMRSISDGVATPRAGGGGGGGGGESFLRVHWVAVPEAVRARRVNRRWSGGGLRGRRRRRGWGQPPCGGGGGGGGGVAGEPSGLRHALRRIHCTHGAGAASVASFEAAVLTEIYLCNVCPCQE